MVMATTAKIDVLDAHDGPLRSAPTDIGRRFAWNASPLAGSARQDGLDLGLPQARLSCGGLGWEVWSLQILEQLVVMLATTVLCRASVCSSVKSGLGGLRSSSILVV
jgi:hypothetical protein